jgi:hypothetical protein
MNYDVFPFSEANHGCDVTYDPFHYVYVAEKDGAIAHVVKDGWSLVCCWSSVWDAEKDVEKDFSNPKDYDIKPISIHILAHVSPAIVLDGEPILIKSTNIVNTKASVLTCPDVMYPDAAMLWHIAVDKEAKSPITDKNGNPFADLDPFELMTSIYKHIGEECIDKLAVGDYVIVAYTLLVLSKMSTSYNVNGKVYSPSVSLLLSKHGRNINKENRDGI